MIQRSFADLDAPFLGSLALAEGALDKADLASPLFTRVFRNVYVPAGVPMTHALRCQAAALIAPPSAVVTGCSAAAVRGFELVNTHDPVELMVPESVLFDAQTGIHIRRTSRLDVEHEPWAGIGLATPMRMTFDLLTNTNLHRSLPRTVAYLDVVLRSGQVAAVDLRELLLARRDNGIVRARRALALADSRAESMPESELRVWLAVGGLNPEPQVTVFDEHGRFLGRLDLAFKTYKVAVEYDGDWHRDGDQPVRDATRRGALEAAGWRFVIVTKAELYGEPKALVRRIQSELSRESSWSVGVGVGR